VLLRRIMKMPKVAFSFLNPSNDWNSCIEANQNQVINIMGYEAAKVTMCYTRTGQTIKRWPLLSTQLNENLI
jgi:hypothetical protein